MRPSRSLFIVLWCGLALLPACTQSAPPVAGSELPTPTPSITPAVLLPGTPTTISRTPFALGTIAAATPFATFVAPAGTAVPILMYHQVKDLLPTASLDDFTWTVSPVSLDAQLGYLAEKGYVTISLDQLLDGFAGKAALPAKPVVLTFDDGWKTQYTNALPLLKKRNQTATFYVVSTYMGYGAYFDWTMTEAVRDAGMTIAGHTLDHSDLTKLSTSEKDRQLRDSKAALEKQLGVKVTHFAYPNGAFNDATIEAVKRAGYRSATTINPTLVKSPVSAYVLPRIRVSYKETLADFAKKLP